MLVLVAACGGDSKPAPEPSEAPAQDVQIARELAAAYYAQDNKAEARAALAPLVAKERAATEDLVSAAIVELLVADVDKAKAFLDRAAKQSPRDAGVHYNLGRLAEMQADFAAAAAAFERALASAPGDAPTMLHLAGALEDSDPARSQSLLRQVIAQGVDRDSRWYPVAVYRLAMLLRTDPSTKDEAERLLAEKNLLDGRGIKSPSDLVYAAGNLGLIRAPTPRGTKPGAGHMPHFEPPQPILPEFGGATDVFASDLDNDSKLDLVAYGPHGLVIGLQRAAFAWEARKLVDGAVDRALTLDLGSGEAPGGDDDMDVVYVAGKTLHVLEATKEGTPSQIAWRAWTGKLPELAFAPRDVVAVDHDHEGDLDLLFVGDFGALLLRNDGAGLSDKGAFTDVTAEAQLPRGRAFAWCVTEDFDTDQDVDFLLSGESGSYLASNLRGGKFEDRSAWLAALSPPAMPPVVADFDGDARPDVWNPGRDGSKLHRGQPSGTFAAPIDLPVLITSIHSPTPAGAQRVWALDFDFDGALDLVSPSLDGTQYKLNAALAPGVDSARSPALKNSVPTALATPPMMIDDIDGDLAWDVLALTDIGVAVQRGAQKDAHVVRLGFRGRKDNRRGVGAVVELRAGGVYRRIYWRGENQLAGVGESSETDFVRVTWPNGIIQYDTRRDLGDRTATKDDPFGLLQSPGLGGSCPFLYTWNGERFVFVTDVLGITPLGLPMAPGMLVPPDHDEYVLVRGDQLKPKDGVYELQFTEELREVTYLDRIRLDVVDHPAGTEIYPNELFCFPPFPEAHTHTVRSPLAPKRATGSDGRDWTSALAKIDDDYAAPFTPIATQVIGLATPHTLELEFDAAALASAKKLRLVMTGWFFWTDASVNMAAARDGVNAFVPPILQLPDGAGGWKDAGPPIGFPAGKTKSMVIDVTQLLKRDDPRLRLFSTLRLYWDSIRLAVDDDDAELDTRSLEPSSAKLWRRGFSAPDEPLKPFQPERFEWHRLADFPRWDQHPGLYTKYGETLPLVQQVDDQFVILGAGDALTVTFDARSLPPPRAGFVRDYLVFMNGWAKDRDPNTIEALYVEPLPFHGMSGYPYRADEHFPDDAAHRAWRLEWNTRPAHQWIEPVTPVQ